jgi:cyclophilin family peptidyl-prolyl cis-trans isomerase
MLILAFLLAALAAPQTATYPDGLYMELNTNKGLIALQLEYEKVPMTTANFVGLAEGTIQNKALPLGTPYFDGTVFHRVVSGHVIQAGRPKATETGPGYTFPNEIVSSLSHGKAGMLGVANGGPHTNASQFYVTLGDRSYLDGNYTVFGHVVRGMDVVMSIVQGDVVESVKIVRVGKKANAFKPDTAMFTKMADAARAQVKEADERKARSETAQIAKRWPAAVTSPKGAKFVVLREVMGQRVQPGQKIKVVYTGRYLNGGQFSSSIDEGRPVPGQKAEAFDYEVGKTRITPALDEAIENMKPGDRRIVIAQGALAYGASGFYAKEVPGKKRFVISPNTTLVYEVEITARQ